jgi:hypothetical protein
VRNSLLLCLVVWSVGCAENRQYFRPTEHVYGHTIHGQAEAIYALVGPHGPFGEAKVWSPGAFREDGSTLLHVQIDVHNTSGAPIVVDPVRIQLDPIRVGRQLLRGLTPIERQPLAIAPGAFGRISLRFALPPGVRAGEITAFGLHWSVDNGPQSYAQVTPFLEDYGRFGPGYPPVYGYGYGYFCSPYDAFCARGYYGYPMGGAVIMESHAPMRPHAVVRVH